MAVAFRLLSLIFIVSALMLLGADVITSLEKGTLSVRSIEQVWGLLNASGLNSFKSWVDGTLPGPVPGWIDGLMSLWAFGVTGVLGVILAFIFGRRHSEA